MARYTIHLILQDKRYFVCRFLCRSLLYILVISSWVLPTYALGKPKQQFPKLEAPIGKVILTVSGEIRNQNDDENAVFGLENLKKLTQNTIQTSLPWGQIKYRFKGVLLNDILTVVGAKPGSELVFEAWDGYRITIKWRDIVPYSPILAFSRNSVPLTRRDRGPLWLIFDPEKYEILKKPFYNNYWIWQLKRIDVK